MPNAATNIQVPATSASTIGVRSPILQGYVFASGIHSPEVSSILSYKYPQYYMTSLLDRLGAEETVENDIYSWFIQDRTRKGSTVVSIDAGGTGNATTTITTGFSYDASAGDLGYLIAGDALRLESGVLVRVNSVADNGGSQQAVVVKVDGTNFVAGDITAGDAFGHSHSLFGEYSSAPDGRLYTPDEEYNTLSIIRRSTVISGSEFTNKTYLSDGKSWYFEKEEIEMKELARDKENAIIFGELSTGSIKSARGILDYALTYGVNNGFSSAVGVSEEDFQNQMKELMIEGVSNEITVLCGAQFLADAQNALKDYSLGGGTALQSHVGLSAQKYSFMGKTISLVYHELFDDTAVLPTPVNGVGTGARIDFSNFSLWLDLGTENTGRSLITLKYKSHNGNSRKFIHAYEVGLMNPAGENGGMVANGRDGFSVHYLIECGVEVRLPNRLGILRATA